MSGEFSEVALTVGACLIDASRSTGSGGDVVGSDAHRVALWAADDALRSAGIGGAIDAASAPKVAARLRERGVATVCVAAVAQVDGGRLHWLDSEHARGWIEPVGGIDSGAGAGRAVLFARTIADALAQGFVGADAVLLACADAGALPRLSWGVVADFATRSLPTPQSTSSTTRSIGLYALVDNARQLQRVLDAGVRTVQLRIKRPPDADEKWEAMVRAETAACIAAARAVGAELILNDHWQLAAGLDVAAVHLGQEDLMRLGDRGRAALVASGVRLGISSHSVWELCRARSLAARYIACGPVWPTTTKDMPWLPQGPDNLAWWCRHAGAPVVAIGGILDPEQARIAARAGADGVCLVRALGDDPAAVVPAYRQAIELGRSERDVASAGSARWPHPTLPASALAAPDVASFCAGAVSYGVVTCILPS